ncbi:heparinase [Parabacteroides sp. 52]|uniref:heparinase II/III family protein n=1 Tax=unclassified Parabacteroides TaxID=2649774 RepID=UPI0013D04CB6|nr:MULTISPECIES: heparinase II/III-family protein [unclassified Parabacteroides]MDH6535592.1 hypothetical protein [Parabacteroides sp. PM5-20]NDV55457.1 heparinase [Parabacteroides sp. 52]
MKASKLLFLFFILFFVSSKGFAYTEKNLLQKNADYEKVKTSLVLHQKWVRYPAYDDRAGWDKLIGGLKENYITQGEKQLDYVWQVVTAGNYLEFERSGNRTVMERPLNNNLQVMYDLFMAELAEGKGRFIDQLINGVFHTCEMTSWALSAHLNAQTTHRSLPDYREHYIDLMAGDVGATLSWMHHFLAPSFDKVDPAISERIRHELRTRIMEPYMNQDNFWWMAANYKPGMMINNWNPWCNSGVLQTFLLIENDREKLAKAVCRTMVSVDKFINYTHDDGACEEGPAYWESAAGKMYDYLQILSDATNEQVNIFNDPLLKRMGEYIVYSYIGDGWVVNFADASAKGGGDLGLIYRYGKATGSALMMQHASSGVPTSGRKSALARCDVYRGFQALEYAEELASSSATSVTPPVYTWYPQTEFCYMTNKQGFFVAAKGGFNDESHNHNDIGSFVLYVDQTPILIDAGVGTYTRQTFSSERYTIWTMQSNYHNLPVINGVPQAYGKKYKATDVTFNPRRMCFSSNIATAYPPEAKVKEWIRSYTLKSSGLTIEDRFDLEAAEQGNQLNFLTCGDVDTSRPGEIIIRMKDKKVSLAYDKNTFIPAVETITLEDPRLSSVWGESLYRISLDTQKTPVSGAYRFVVKKID